MQVKCGLRRPPGDEIYKTTAPILERSSLTDGTPVGDPPTTTGAETSHGRVQHLSMFEVDGKKGKLYCQVFLVFNVNSNC